MPILATAGALNQIVAGVQRAADKPNDLSPSAIVSSASDIKSEVSKSLGATPTPSGPTLAIVETRNPLLSPSFLVTVVGLIATVATLFGYTGISDPETQKEIVSAIGTIVTVVVSIRAFYSDKVSSTAVSKP